MKRILAWMLTLMLLAGLAACGETDQANSGAQETVGDTAPQETEPEQGGEPAVEEAYSFTLEGVELIPGAAFDPAKLPEAASIFQVPSCAIEGTDDVYNYNTVEVTAFDDGTGAVVYSIYLVDANTSTAEGLYLGDDQAQVEALYGTDYTENGPELIYQKGKTQLRILMDGGFVSSIEYRMVTE